MLLGCRTQQGIPDFAYAAVTLSGRPFAGSFRYPFVLSPCRRNCRSLQSGPTTPDGQRRQAWHPSGLGSSRFARRYLGNRNCFLFLRVLRWFTSPGWLALSYVFRKGVASDHDAGFPHSDIDGSRDVCSSPSLIAAYHVLHRLHAPRHPPCALCSLPKRIYPSANFKSHVTPILSLPGSDRSRAQTETLQLFDCQRPSPVPRPSPARNRSRPAFRPFLPPRAGKSGAGAVPISCETSSPEDRGGGEGTRTPDPLLAKQVLCQLSYTPTLIVQGCLRRPSAPPPICVVGLGRLELPTSRLSGVRSSQLSYRPTPRTRSPRPLSRRNPQGPQISSGLCKELRPMFQN